MLSGQFWAVLRPTVAAIRPARCGDPAAFRCYPASFAASCGRDQAGSPRRSGRFPMLSGHLWP
eukprot:4910219-Alexandrium_andersonii.AAC.1